MAITTIETKVCRTCHVPKPLVEFDICANGPQGRDSRCKPCKSAQWRARRDRDHEGHNARQKESNKQYRASKSLYRRRSYVLDRYGVEPEILTAWAEAKFLEQDGRCACCGRQGTVIGLVAARGVVRLVVDHDHETGALRGLLCDLCNTALGKLRDSPVVVAQLLQYITDWKTT